MKLCFYILILSLLIIVFAWRRVGWGHIALTVIGGLLAVLAITGICCCAKKKE